MAWDGRGGGQNPPDFEEIINKIKGAFKGKFPVGPIFIGIFVLLWLASGIYIVAPDEVGVVKRFGKVAYSTGPGPHYHLPWPAEAVLKPKVTTVRRLEVGFRTVVIGPPSRYRTVPVESLMLTGDENIIDMQFIVQYKIKNAPDFLFNVKDPEKTVKNAAEAAMRDVVGKNKIDEALTEGKFQIQQDTKQLLQLILDDYKTGISVDAVQLQDVHPPKEVVSAFKDVASAKENKIKFINDAEGYRNDILPKAKGKAAQIINEAQAYREAKVKEAEGDASRFTQILKEYRKARNVTKKRLYLETMEEVLMDIEKVVIDSKHSGNLIPFLPLKGLESMGNKKDSKIQE
jgi:membrane protease subunit HflK